MLSCGAIQPRGRCWQSMKRWRERRRGWCWQSLRVQARWPEEGVANCGRGDDDTDVTFCSKPPHSLLQLSWHCIMAVCWTDGTDACNLTFVTVLLYQHCIGYYLKYILPDYKQRMCITNVLSFVSVFFGCDFTHFYHYLLKLLPTDLWICVTLQYHRNRAMRCLSGVVTPSPIVLEVQTLLKLWYRLSCCWTAAAFETATANLL